MSCRRDVKGISIIIKSTCSCFVKAVYGCCSLSLMIREIWENSVCLSVFFQLLQFQKAGLFTVGAAARPCAQLHYGLTEKHMRKVRIYTHLPTMTWYVHVHVKNHCYIVTDKHINLSHNMCVWCVCRQGKQRVVRRDSVVRVELAELSAELDLDILTRLGNLSKAFAHCPTDTAAPGLMQVGPYMHLFQHKEKYLLKRRALKNTVISNWIRHMHANTVLRRNTSKFSPHDNWKQYIYLL